MEKWTTNKNAIYDKKDNLLALTYMPNMEQNAELIVKAVNACIAINKEHPELVAQNIEGMYQVLKTISNSHLPMGAALSPWYLEMHYVLSAIEGDK